MMATHALSGIETIGPAMEWGVLYDFFRVVSSKMSEIDPAGHFRRFSPHFIDKRYTV